MTFQSRHPAFDALVDEGSTVELLLEEPFPFAHEAGVFIADTDCLYVTSNRLIDGNDDQRVQVSRVRLSPSVNREDVASGEMTMANGGVNYQNGIVFCAQGNKTSPSGLYHTKLGSSDPITMLVSDFNGRPFNSLNDVVVHSDGSIWFTDPSYGYEQGFRPPPRLPSQVYRYQPGDNSIRAMADGFGHPNGICFSPDEDIAYVTDTDWINGDGTSDDTKVSSIYAFDIRSYSGQPFLTNRRLFAMCDTGVPDGIKCDLVGNVYSGCGDGINVWSPGGLLIGKILIDGGVANFCFGRRGHMYLLNETRLWLVKLSSRVQGALLRL